MKRKGPFRWGALTGLVMTLAGVATDPHVVAAIHAVWPALPGPVSAVLTITGAIIAAKTKPVVRKEYERNSP